MEQVLPSKFVLNKGCKFITGAVRAAIYDLKGEKVYSINASGRRILEQALQGYDISLFEQTASEYLEALVVQELGSFVNFTRGEIEDEETDFCNALNFIWLELTSECNLRCKHCYGSFGPNMKEKDTLLLDDWKQVIYESMQLGCKELQFIGGEPLLFKDFESVMQYANQCGFKITVFTNSTLIKEEHLKLFSKYQASVRVTVYGSTDNVHDAITQVPGSFKKTQKALKLLRMHNIPTSIAVIIMQQNQSDLSRIVEYIQTLGYEFNGYDIVRPTGRGTEKDLTPTDESVLMGRVLNKPNFGIDYHTFNTNRRFNSCWNGKCAVTAQGAVIPCIFAREYVMGNLREQTLKQILSGAFSKELSSITKDSIEVCKDCEYRYACKDCRPLALSVNNNLYSKYPRCTYDPYSGEWNSSL